MYSELQDSSEIINDSKELQARLSCDGYLFFRRLIEPDSLLGLRRQMLEVIQRHGWLAAGSALMDGIARDGVQCTEGDLEYSNVYHQVYRLEEFHRIAHRPEILSLVERIRGCPMLAQPQKVARLWFPKFTDHTTPTHQDFVHFQGTHDNLTSWSPVGNCPRELGGLAVLRGSHRVNRVLEHHFSLGAGSLNLFENDYQSVGSEWLTTDYEVGDTLIFPALTIHKALPNLTENRLRISLDNRYQRTTDPIAEHMLGPHLNSIKPITWEEIYEGWSSRELQYYWKQHQLETLPRITDFLDRGFEEAVELTQKGDPKARLHLERIARKEPESDQGKRAHEVLSSSPVL